MSCVHCGRDKVNRPRGLCWSCYYKPGVRDLYGVPQMGYARGNHTRPLPEKPTQYPAGSVERILIYAERAKNGQQLWHPDDSRTITLRMEQGIGKTELKKLWKKEMDTMNDQRTTRTLSDAIGGPPTEAFKMAWTALQVCTQEELAYLRTDGISAIQLARVDEVVTVPVHQGAR